MYIKLSNKRDGGNAILLGLMLAMGLALGGCALEKIISKARKIEKQRQQAATNCVPDEFVEFHYDTPPGSSQEPPLNAVAPPSVPSFQPSAKFQVNTNYYNEALEDESGF